MPPTIDRRDQEKDTVAQLVDALERGDTALSLDYLPGFETELLRDMVAALVQRPAAAGKVVELDLGGNHMGPAEVSVLAPAVPHLRSLATLDLRDNRIGPEGWLELQMLLEKHCPHLTAVDLSENHVRDVGAQRAAHLLTNVHGIKALSLSTNALTPAAVPPLLAGVANSATLVELYLDYNGLGDEGAAKLGEGLCLLSTLKLQRLGLSDNAIACRGAEAVCRVVTMPGNQLTWLNLSVNKIGPAGCRALASALRHRNCRLTSLDLGNNPVEDEGANALCQSLSQFATLENIDLCSMDLDDGHFQTLFREVQKPACRVSVIEWFNNPRVTFPVEKQLGEYLEAKTLRLKEKAEQRDRATRALRVAAGAVAVAVAAFAVVRFVRRRP